MVSQSNMAIYCSRSHLVASVSQVRYLRTRLSSIRYQTFVKRATVKIHRSWIKLSQSSKLVRRGKLPKLAPMIAAPFRIWGWGSHWKNWTCFFSLLFRQKYVGISSESRGNIRISWVDLGWHRDPLPLKRSSWFSLPQVLLPCSAGVLFIWGKVISNWIRC